MTRLVCVMRYWFKRGNRELDRVKNKYRNKLCILCTFVASSIYPYDCVRVVITRQEVPVRGRLRASARVNGI